VKIIDRDIWLCEDCMIYAVNGDLPEDLIGTPNEHWIEKIEAGMEQLPYLLSNFGESTCPACNEGECSKDHSMDESGELEFSHITCRCCKSNFVGKRYRFAQLGPEGNIDPSVID